MSRKGKSVTLSIDESDLATLEDIALEFGQTWGDRGNISALMKAIAQGKLRVDWADAQPADNPKRVAINAAIALIQEGLSKLLRLL
jgi:hypothetical protein